MSQLFSYFLLLSIVNLNNLKQNTKMDTKEIATTTIEVEEKTDVEITDLLISQQKAISIQKKAGALLKVLVNEKDFEFPVDFLKDKNLENAHEEVQKLKRDTYVNFLKSQFENLVILSGAGTSVGWGGLTMAKLWEEVETNLSKDVFKSFCSVVSHPIENIDLEALLSKANRATEFVTTPIKDKHGNDKSVSELILICEGVIKDKCSIPLNEKAPHLNFLNKLVNRKAKDPRVKVFTLNYDTLFEQAAIKGNFTVIDGFSFSFPRTLSGRNFDLDVVFREKTRITEEESFVSRVFHLYKLHGSINWERNAGDVVIKENSSKPLIVYPKDSKYENSYEQPYFEMMSRFQQNLRNDNVLLISVGFSFNDKHIVTVIKEAVTQNPSFRLLIISRDIKRDGPMNWFIEKSKTQSNIIIVGEEYKTFVENYPYSKMFVSQPEKYDA
ncbi:MAG: hypothetical protein POELPBGB_02938 [Bacteroidia bacterium]|nr:hypothetical protein [Bacteroidia bacterium]